MFQSTFGIKINIASDTLIRSFSSYEFTSTYEINNKLTYVLDHLSNVYFLDCCIPGSTLYPLLSYLTKLLDHLLIDEFGFCDTSMAAAPAAISMVPYFTKGDIGTLHPNKKIWFDSLKYDSMTNLLVEIVENTDLSSLRSNLEKLHSVYHQP